MERNCSNLPVVTSVPMDFIQTYQTLPQYQPSPVVHHSPPEAKPYTPYPTIDLSEWREHRVLAKHRGLYIPGVIRQAEGSKVLVELDGQENDPAEFADVFGANKHDIISDACPLLVHISVGMSCVVRADLSREGLQNVFLEGYVSEILNSNPRRIRVKVCKNHSCYKRENLRFGTLSRCSERQHAKMFIYS